MRMGLVPNRLATLRFFLSRTFLASRKRSLRQVNLREPTARPANTARDLEEECSFAAADSLAVMARRIAASAALSSKRTLAPSDRTPSCVHKPSKSTLTGLSFILAYSG